MEQWMGRHSFQQRVLTGNNAARTKRDSGGFLLARGDIHFCEVTAFPFAASHDTLHDTFLAGIFHFER